MHILMTVNAAWNIWNFRRTLVKALIDDGHRVTVYAPADSSVSSLEALGCKFLPLEMDVKGLNPIEGLSLWCRFRHTIKEQQPDVILSYTIKNNLFGALGARSANAPFIPNVTGLGTAFLSGGALQIAAKFLYRWAFGSLPVVFFQNQDDQDLFTSQGMLKANQARVLPGSGVDLERFAAIKMPDNTNQPVFLMIARLLRDKGVVEFVDAARQVKLSHPDARFQLLGAVGSENRTAIDDVTLQSWVAEGVVEYLGTTSDVRPLISAASCVVLPSYREGAPRTLIEAAAMGRPLIATDVPGCRDVVDHGISGFLCPVRNSAGLAGAVELFLELSNEAREVMGKAGRKKMEREYADTLVVNSYRNAISTVTKNS